MPSFFYSKSLLITIFLLPTIILAQSYQNPFKSLMYNNDYVPWSETATNFQENELFNSTQSDSNVVLVGRWANGPCYAVAVKDSIAYFGNGGYLEIADISNPAHPIILGKIILSPLIRDIYINGNYAYVADDKDGLRIIDVSNPTEPKEVGSFDTEGIARGVVVNGSYAYIADRENGLRIIDVSNPTEPNEVGFFDTESNAYGVAVIGAYAYIANSYDGLRIIDVSNPTEPKEVGSFDTEGLACGVVVIGSYAYIADLDGLRIIDVSNPTEPKEVGFFNTERETFCLTVSGRYAYVADRKDVCIIDVSNPADLSEVGSIDTEGSFVRDIAVNGINAYVANQGNGLHIIDISNPVMLKEVGFYKTGGVALGIAINESYAYLAANGNGLHIIELNNLTVPKEIGYFDTYDAKSVAIYENYAYVADYQNGLCIIDVSNPANPYQVGHLKMGGFASDIKVYGSYAYIACESGGLSIIDVGNPSDPSKVGSFNGYYIISVAVVDTYAYIGVLRGGLRIIDVSNPEKSKEVGSFDTKESAESVAITGNYAYVANGWNGLRIIDIKNPAEPREVGSFDTEGYAYDVAVSGTYAYVADGNNGLHIIDVCNPSAPREVGFFYTRDFALSVSVSGDFAYVADGFDGLYILKLKKTSNHIWQSIQRDMKNSGQSPYEGIDQPELIKTFKYNDYHITNGVIDAHGNSYFLTFNKFGLLSLSPQLTVNWFYEITQNKSFNSNIALTSKGDIIFNSLNVINSVNSLGHLNWKYQSDLNGEYDLGGLAINAFDEIIAVGFNGKLIMLSNDGTLLWEMDLNDQFYKCPPAVYDDGTIILSNADDESDSLTIYSISRDGNLNWKLHIDDEVISNGFAFRNPIIGPDNNIYFCSSKRIFSISDSGTINWQLQPFPSSKYSGDHLTCPPVQQSDSTIAVYVYDYIHSNHSSIRQVWNIDARTGEKIWSVDIDGTMNFYAPLITDKNGNIYGVQCEYFDPAKAICISGQGEIKWEVKGGSEMWGLMLDNLNRLYVPSGNSVFIYGEQPTKTIKRDIPLKTFTLAQNYPNPFNPTTTIRYSIHNPGQVQLIIYNILGQKVKTLVKERKMAGEYSVTWNGTNNFGEKVSSGIYIYQLRCSGKVENKKMILIR